MKKSQISGPRLFIGLGNPGPEYENTYHNVGQLAVAWLLRGSSVKSKTKKPLLTYIRTPEAIWVAPLVFMNESGKAVAHALRFFQISPEAMIVIHDDSDIAIGDFKISFNRSSAGHKGVESIIKAVGTQKFFRARIGIRPPAARAQREKASRFVLNSISPKHQAEFERVFERLRKALRENLLLDSERN